MDLHYNGFCNSVLWQLFHYIPLNLESKLSDTRTLNLQWKAHQEANRKFAEVTPEANFAMVFMYFQPEQVNIVAHKQQERALSA